MTLSTTIMEKVTARFVDMNWNSKLLATGIHDTDLCVGPALGFSGIGSGGLVARRSQGLARSISRQDAESRT